MYRYINMYIYVYVYTYIHIYVCVCICSFARHCRSLALAPSLSRVVISVLDQTDPAHERTWKDNRKKPR